MKVGETRGRPRAPKTYRCGLLDQIMREIDRSSLPAALIEQESGIPPGALANLRHNDPENPSIVTMTKIADFMGLAITVVPKMRKRDRLSREAIAAMAHGRRKALAKRRGVEVPPTLEADWLLLKRNKYDNAAAAAALKLPYNGADKP